MNISSWLNASTPNPTERPLDRDLGFGNDPPETGDQLVDIDMRTASSQWRYGVHHVI